MFARASFLASAAVVLIAAAHCVGDTIPDARPIERPSPGHRGTGACSAVACHGSPEPSPVGRRILTNEHTTWVVADKHASAYQVLFTERSVRMADILRLGPAHESARCLACHTTPAPQGAAIAWSGDGVSCESCHGPADRWLGPHTTLGWRQLDARDKEQRFGLFATKDLARRAQVCAACHVGATGRDVDHDLIAAGHPALRFEFSAYHALMPPHWVEKGRNAAGNFPARAWAVGRVASAKAALELLSDRAERHAWPEFAEYSCFSCHRPIETLPGATATARSRAQTPWGTWYFALRETAADEDPFGPRTELNDALDALKRYMESASPDPAEASAKARRAADLCATWLERSRPIAPDRDALRRYALLLSRATPEDWDGQAQRYLGLVALRQAVAGPDVSLPNRTALLRLRDELRFPVGSDTPRPLRIVQGVGGAGGSGRTGSGGP